MTPATPVTSVGPAPLTRQPPTAPNVAEVTPLPPTEAPPEATLRMAANRPEVDSLLPPPQPLDAEPSDPRPTADIGAAPALPVELQAAREAAAPPPGPRAPVIDQVAHAVARGVDEGASQVTIRLHPPVLGTVRVTLTVSDSGDVSAQLSAATDLGQRVLHDGLPRLAAALTDRGVDVGQLSVSVGERDAPAPFFEHSQSWERSAESWQTSAPMGLAVENEPDLPERLLTHGHHLIDLLA